MRRRVKITDTTLRDGHQSLWATRMRTEHMLPILEKLDRVGYHSLEVWGGATFDVCLRYLKEDPWERLRAIKKIVKNTPLQMLLRGQSLVGYQHYPDDVVERFVFKAVENGIDIIRIFDALNDIRNMEVPIKAAKAAGAHVQAAVVYTVSPVHTLEHYVETAKRLVEMGADSICIKDMAGLCTPYQAYELVAALKRELGVPLQFHSHYIGGLAVGAYLKAIEAGVDVVDTASVPLAFGASQPPVETVVRALADTPYDTGLNIHELFEIARYFEDLRKRLGYERGVTRISDMRVFEHQVPGGMITNLISQLEEQKALHRLEEVLEEIPRVRAELGYPPLVTPTSQIVGTQAVLNVLTGERYKLIPGEVRSYVQGLYGRPPAPIDPEIKAKILGDLKPVECRPADLLEPRMEKIKEEIKDLARSEEDLLSYALFPQIARKFFEEREQGKLTPVVNNKEVKQKTKELRKEEQNLNLKEVRELILLLNETNISELIIESEGTKIAIKKGQGSSEGTVTMLPQAPVTEAKGVESKEKVEEKNEGNFSLITSPMVGTFYRAPAPGAPPFVEVGQKIKPGDVLCIIEAMKLMNEIESEISGEIVEILVENGEMVEYGQPLFKVKV
ncbi:sodium-extruding oxaloacetate decarboxylase subunit alpha [Carboxydothermus hydrogenoformans]|uniref:Oxaloacetate decarboxylase, alpha subunit n=1 Tax=Carboxydothermus hydrogenoformans (strain ATCC BAA-161 / DSM 6008 / Z-2901) TaxID=246194 RepID=Q3AAL6_CARHZ|nr:sodium-extruding oxaloacetate decarboxylase subunit alpha [Carboxydothermus hydrogenoformans]ABB13909.1 oxaloacetate decarboxylase, alpha subunit [Carboxydothermus hydrogenoformans Z-2901]